MSEHLKHKMYTHEVPPPVEVWQAVQAELDAASTSVAERVYDWEVPPPAGAWEAVSAALDQQNRELSKPLRHLYPRVYRWAAIAAIVLLVFSGIYYFTSSPISSGGSIASAGAVVNTDQPKKIILPEVKPRRTSPAKEKTPPSYYRPYYAQYNSPVKEEHTDTQERPLHSSLVEETDMLPEEQEVYVHARQILGASGEPIQDMSIVNPDNDKYISITAPNGQQTKVSSKLAIAMPYLGLLDAEQSDAGNWKQLILEWREKILQSGFIPSSANFLDILEFTELIND